MKTNCIVSCSPKQGITEIDVHVLREMVINSDPQGNVRQVWYRLMLMGKQAEQVGHYKMAEQLYRQAMEVCIEDDYKELTRRHAYRAQDAARALDRLWEKFGHQSDEMGYVLSCYRDIYWLSMGE